MKKILKSSILIVILFISTYLLFVFPFDIFKIWTDEKNINWLYSFISTIITFIIVRTYFATKITFTPLRIFVCEGIGIGFIAFNLVCLILILDVFLKWEEHIKSNFFFNIFDHVGFNWLYYYEFCHNKNNKNSIRKNY